MSERESERSILEQGADDLGRVVDGLASLLVGKRGPEGDTEPQQPVFGEDMDRAVQDLGAAFGNVLQAAGDHLQRVSGDPAPPLEEEAEDTPLVHGARSLGRGLALLVGEVMDSLQPGDTPREEDPDASPDDSGSP